MSLYRMWLKYPATLTDREWAKQSGILARIFKRDAAIVAKLKTCENAFGAIQTAHFSDFDVDLGTKAACEKSYKSAVAEYGGAVTRCCDQLSQLSKLCSAKAVELGMQSVLHQSAMDQAKLVAATAQAFGDDIRLYCNTAIAEIRYGKSKTAA